MVIRQIPASNNSKTGKVLFFAAISVLTGVFALANPVGAATSPWSTQKANLQRNSQSEFEGPSAQPSVLWTYAEEPGNPIYSSLVIGQDRTIYVSVSGGILSINPDGTRKSFEPDIPGPLIVQPDGAVSTDPNPNRAYSKDELTYYYTQGNTLYSADSATDTILWQRVFEPDSQSYPCPPNINVSLSPPIVSNQGTIYVPAGGVYCDDKGNSPLYVFLISPDNQLLTSFNLGTYSTIPAVSPDGTTYFIHRWSGPYDWGERGNLTAINPDGSTKWSINLFGQSSPVIISNLITDSQNNLYFTIDTTAYCYSNNGQKLWEQQLSAPLDWQFCDVGLALLGDGTLCVFGRGSIIALK